MPSINPPKQIRINSLPQLNKKDTNDLGILVKGSDAINRNVESARPLFRPPPATPRDRISSQWRPNSSLRILGSVNIPTLEDSTTEVLNISLAHKKSQDEKDAVQEIKKMFAGAVNSPSPSVRNAACSPLSSWGTMTEDLLEHVSQRVALDQQRTTSSRSGNRNSRPNSSRHQSRPTSRMSTSRSLHIMTPGSLNQGADEKPPTGSKSRGRKRPKSSKPDISVRRNTSRSQSVLSYRGSLSETGIDLPPKTIERLVQSFETQKLPAESLSRPCSRLSDFKSVKSFDSSKSYPFYEVMREKVYQGFNDMLKAFEVYDKVRAGYLKRDDFAHVVRHFTVNLKNQQIATLLKRCEMKDDWDNNCIPYKKFLLKYMDRGRSGYIKHYIQPSNSEVVSDRPQTGDSGLADLAETRIIAQLHSDFVDVLENFRVYDSQDTGCVEYAEFKNVLSRYGLTLPPHRGDEKVNYVDYLNSVALQPPDEALPTPTPATSRPQTAPPEMMLPYRNKECDLHVDIQQVTLNMGPTYEDPRISSLVKPEECKIIKGGKSKPPRPFTSIQCQIARKYGNNNADLRRLMGFYDVSKSGKIPIKAFRDVLRDINIKVDENDFYSVVNSYDTSFQGLIPYKHLLKNVK